MSSDDPLAAALVEHAYLEGDFLLRSGRRSLLLDECPLRDPARPAPGDRRSASPRPSREHAPDATRLAGPARRGRARSGGVARVGAAVPDRAQGGEEVGTAKRLEGPFEEGEIVCLVEDVVTSGGALASSRWSAPRSGPVVHTAVCVVDREEGGADALARQAVRLRPLFRAGELLANAKSPAKLHG